MQANSNSKILYRFSSLFLWGVFLLFFWQWLISQAGTLFDPMLHNGDARQHLFAFHRYGNEKYLVNDPIALEFLAQVPPAFRLLYALLVPLFGLFISPKIVQLLCYLLVFWSALSLIRSPRWGLASGILLLFLYLHTAYILDRTAGGLPRSFGFPSMVLWGCGVLLNKQKERYVGAIVACLFYPPAALLILVSDGLFTVCKLFTVKGRTLVVLRNFVIFSVVCLSIIGTYALTKSDQSGKLPTLDEAMSNKAFCKGGRTERLPFPDVVDYSKKYFSTVFAPVDLPVEVQNVSFDKYRNYYLLIPLNFALLVVLGISPVPRVALACFSASLLLYLLSCFLAFKLYIPDRYIEYGMPLAALFYTISIVGLSWEKLQKKQIFDARRNFTAAFCIIIIIIITGLHPGESVGTSIDGRYLPKLDKTIKRLPYDVLISGHPNDLSSIPFFTGRAVTDNYETTLPWLTKSWDAKVIRVQESLSALYAENYNEILAYFEKYRITQMLINSTRYRADFHGRARLFEPMDSFLRAELKGKNLQSLVFRPENIPSQAILCRDHEYILVDVAILSKMWGRTID